MTLTTNAQKVKERTNIPVYSLENFDKLQKEYQALPPQDIQGKIKLTKQINVFLKNWKRMQVCCSKISDYFISKSSKN